MKNEKLYRDIIDNFKNMKYALLKAQTFNPRHFGFPDIYYKIMETDDTRINSFKRTFERHDNFRGKTVCEAGVGTLALSRYYLPFVKKAYLIELNPALIPGIKTELKKNGWDKKTQLIIGDAMKVTLPEKVDFLIAETMSIFCANEYQVQIFKNLRRFLKPGGKLIPEKIVNLVQLGRAEFDQGYNHYPILFTRHMPEKLSEQEVLNTIDLYKVQRLKVRRKRILKVRLDGWANCIFMNSWVQISPGVNFTGTDSLMPPTVKLLEEPVELKAGERVILHAEFFYGGNLDDAKFWIEK